MEIWISKFKEKDVIIQKSKLRSKILLCRGKLSESNTTGTLILSVFFQIHNRKGSHLQMGILGL